MCREEVLALLDKYEAVRFPDAFTEGFAFTADRKLTWPKSYDHLVEDPELVTSARLAHNPIIAQSLHQANPRIHPLNPYQPTEAYPPMMDEPIMGQELYFKPEAFETIPRERNGSGNGSKAAGPVRGAKFAAASPVRSAWSNLDNDN